MDVLHLAIGFPSLVWIWLELVLTMHHQWSWSQGNYIIWTSFWARKGPASQVISMVRHLDMCSNLHELYDTKPMNTTHHKWWWWTKNSQNWLFCKTKDERMHDMFQRIFRYCICRDLKFHIRTITCCFLTCARRIFKWAHWSSNL